MARTDAPSGEQIADYIKDNKTESSSFTEVAQMLTDAHAHRPGLWQDDLAQVNAELHRQGIIPELTLVGVQGQDLIARDSDGGIVSIDSSNLSNRQEEQPISAEQIDGRTAITTFDGAGSITVKSGDTTWGIVNDVLASQGVENPTDNQIANYLIEMEKLNGHSLDRIHPGDVLKYPPVTRGGDSTSFTNEPSDNPIDPSAEIPADLPADQRVKLEEVNANYEAAQAAIARYMLQNDGIERNPEGLTVAGLQGLFGTEIDISDEEKRGIDFLVENFSKFEHVTTMQVGGPITSFDPSLLDDWKEQMEDLAISGSL